MLPSPLTRLTYGNQTKAAGLWALAIVQKFLRCL